MKARHLITALIAALALIPVSSASATTFCVPSFHAACPNNGVNVAQANLETAATSNGSDGTADTILIANDHTYTDVDTFTPSGTDQLQIAGAGSTSILTSTTAINAYVANLSNRPTDISNVKIVIPASMPSNGGAGLLGGGGADLTNIHIESHNDGSTGAVLMGGSTWTGGHVFASGAGSISTAFDTNGFVGGAITLDGLTIEDAQHGVLSSESNVAVTLRDSHLRPAVQGAVTVSYGGTAAVENSIVETTTAVAMIASAASSSPVSLTVRHTTIVKTGAGSPSALYAQVHNGAGNGSATIDVKDSIIRGFGQLYFRDAPVSGTIGDANITLGYTNATGGATADNGDGSMTLGTGVISFDPQFVSPTDFRLQPGSPSIDAGDPAAGLTTDFLGALRPVDGDGNGSAIRDQGAYEYQPPVPPSGGGESGSGGGGAGGSGGDLVKPILSGLKFGKVTYKKGGALKLSLSETAGLTLRLKPKKGKTVTIRATGKAGANTIRIKAKKLKPGSYKATVTGTDAAGNTSLTKTLKVKVKR